jgi:HK97 gp10 family phage protein
MHVEGLQQLAQACRELPERIARSALRQATSAGAAVVREEAKGRAPVYTGPIAQGHAPAGTLRKAVFMKQDRDASGPLNQVFVVGVRHGKAFQKVGKKGVNRDAYYFRFVEFGTVKMSARPFIRPAFEMSKTKAVTAIGLVLADRIFQEANGLRK